MSALQAIELSEAENRTVHLRYSAVLAADLHADCAGSTDAGSHVEYWGDDPESDWGMLWRVHLWRRQD
jgi:hypothetical protein